MQVEPVRADAMSNTDDHDKVDKMKKEDNTSENPCSTSESSDTDHDKSEDYVPSNSTSSSDDEENLKILLLNSTRKLILKHPMEYIGIHKKHLYILETLCSHISYKERGQIISKRDVILIVLMTIRTGEAGYQIAHRFGVSNSCVSRILTRYIPIISGCL